MQAILLDSSTVVNHHNNTCWNGVVSPPASAVDHRRHSTPSVFQQWDDSIIGCTSETESPDQFHEAFTPPLSLCHAETSVHLFNAKSSYGSNAPAHESYDGNNLIGHGLPSPYSPTEENAGFDFLDHDGDSQWAHVIKPMTSFRPARMLSIGSDSILHAPSNTPTISASSSFSSGIRVPSPTTSNFMHWGQDGHTPNHGDASMTFCETLPTAPVLPSQTISGSQCMSIGNLYRHDTSFPMAALSDFQSDPYTSSVGLGVSPDAESFAARFTDNNATPCGASRRRSRKVSRRKAKHANEVIFNDNRWPCALDPGGRTVPLPPNGRGGYRAQNPVRRKSKVYCTESIKRTKKTKQVAERDMDSENEQLEDEMSEYEEICGASFDTKEKLKRHKDALHSDERPYRCPVTLTDENGNPLLDENGGPIFCSRPGSQSSRKCNLGDHASKHVIGWIKQFDEYKTKGSSRTPPLVSPEDMQEMVIAQNGLEQSVGPRGILTQLWRRIQGAIEDVDDKFCFPILLDENNRAPRREEKRVGST